ncbi:GNAT family N-acetyltransferase [Aeromicrobium sp. CF4.19]|uniref:GNAT family N-acetyltransferase n=1 Tax=Aeromicrobium sp. CF4.19 TaxID=3373082 RepID=UPI003EE805B3
MTDRLDVREAVPDDLARILELTGQDSMHLGAPPQKAHSGGGYTEPAGVTDAQHSALAEIPPSTPLRSVQGGAPTADPHQQQLVGEVDGVVVATCQVTWIRTLLADGGLFCQVEGVRTDAALRGRGIGAALMAHVEDEARRRGAARLQLTTNKERHDAHRFYDRLGYVASHVGMKKYL